MQLAQLQVLYDDTDSTLRIKENQILELQIKYNNLTRTTTHELMTAKDKDMKLENKNQKIKLLEKEILSLKEIEKNQKSEMNMQEQIIKQ